jgi:hypothetical protein
MAILRHIYKTLFGKDYEAVWRQFSAENNGTYIVGRYDNLDSVEINYANHKIIFDRTIRYQSVEPASDPEFTRVRLEFKTPDELRFRIMNQGFIDSVGKFFGAQDIQVGDKDFDSKFMIKGNDEYKIQFIFSHDTIKRLILLQKDIHLEILDKEGFFDEPIQEGYVMLYYISETRIKDKDQLNTLLQLYQSLIDQMTKTNSMKTIRA